MPTEAEFEQARARFENAAEDAEQIIVPVRQANGPDVLTGGTLTADVEAFIDATGGELDGMAADLRSLASECAARAEECRQAQADFDAYAADYRAYRNDLDRYTRQASASPGDDGGTRPLPPPPPSKPPAYVEIDISIAPGGLL